jgi:uncharacterized protein (TIGR03083 family)
MNDLVTTCGWMERGTTLLLDTLAQLTDAQVEAPTALPGWTGRHLVAHLHHNAEALRRLASWAASGVESRMYAGPGQRNAEIETSAELPTQELRSLVTESAQGLAKDLAALSAEMWAHRVITAQNRDVPASEIPWMRAREVFVHTVDLGAAGGGPSFADFPDDFNAALVDDIVTKRLKAGEGATLAAWLSGRITGVTDLGPWL